MADQSQESQRQDERAEPASNTQRGGMNNVINHLLTNRIPAALWFTRIVTVFFTILFIFPVFGGYPYGYYQKALISNAVTSALRLHERLQGRFQFSRAFFTQMLVEDSCHYLIYSLIFLMGGYPVTVALTPIFLFAILHANRFTKILLDKLGPGSLGIVRNLITRLEANQVSVLRFIACTEIFLMPILIVMIFTGRASLLLPFIYHRFITLRYVSVRNPYSRQLFYELRIGVERLLQHQQCPSFLATVCRKVISLVIRIAPQTQPQAAQQ